MKPILVLLTWRGGQRLTRCLESLVPALPHFDRVVLSASAATTSDDYRQLCEFHEMYPLVEVLCVGRECSTMENQRFWVEYLRRTGAKSDDWIFWLSYDDQLRVAGIEAVVNEEGVWPLDAGTVYVGPWQVRHEGSEELWKPDPDELQEVWTSLSLDLMQMPLLDWVCAQLQQPTYLQMSGSIVPFAAHARLVLERPRKVMPMRIEMATALASRATWIAELAEPVTTVYGRSNSDRSSYGSAARHEDYDLVVRILQYFTVYPRLILQLPSFFLTVLSAKLATRRAPHEEWRVRKRLGGLGE